MDGMISTARRGAGAWSYAFQHRLMTWLLTEVQPKLDRLREIDEKAAARVSSKRRPSDTGARDADQPGGDA